ncbi:P-loop NTPase [Pseudoflavonifractor phocaeensis]|uniref:polysaccharide biosynthesis tyrosine autokinase n=1 Tax=Pseudoflavonifractor phocaeensis TaxID=1870988 RepID=UPI00195B064C|nr:polysaccharide biosynthesis tyrosine autokinase [Pseudoflavonifractor phocaeensis]MBM6937988.1 P-loop NTPase [Pseudoflavonifractor phocaeensis]
MEEQRIFEWAGLNPLCLLQRLGRDFLLILAAGLIAAMAALIGIQNLYQPQYTASATLAVSVKSSSYSSVISNLNMSSEIADTFTQLFESNMFGAIAANQLGVSSLPGTLTASVLPDTNLLVLQVTADDPEDAFRTLKIMLENYDTVSEHVFQNIVLRELDSPSVPQSPSNPVNESKILKMAFLAGAAVMVGILLLVAVGSDTVQTTSGLRRKVDAHLFATIHHEEKNKTLRTKLKRANKGLLVTMPVASFHFTEEIYKLGTKVAYAASEGRRKVFLVTSVAENEGKSTVAANIAISLAERKKKVLLIDGDLHKPAQYKLFGHTPKQELSRIIQGEAPVAAEYLASWDLYAMFGTQEDCDAAGLLDGDGMEKVLDWARKEMDYIIIDAAPAGLFAEVEQLTDLADATLLVVRQDGVSARHINDTVDRLNQGKAKLLGCIFNDVRSLPFSNDHYSYGYEGYGYGYGKGYGYGTDSRSTERQAEDTNGRS